MALSGIQIFKLLPKTNCGDCGVPTCLAFAMSLAAGKAELSACPHVSEESQAQLSEASAPPIRPVVIGIGERTAKVGGETVLFRHEKRFENPCAFAMLLSDTDDAADTKLKKAAEVVYERVGLMLRPELIAVKCDSGDGAKFAAAVAKVVAAGDFNLVLMSQDVTVLEVGLKASGDRKPLLYAATADNVDAVAALAKEAGCPVGAVGSDLTEIQALTAKIEAAGVKDIVIDAGARTLRGTLDQQVWARTAALTAKDRTLGYPTIVFPCEITDDPMKEAVIASLMVAKYAGVIVLSDFAGEAMFPLLVERMNLYTDPQRPLATTEGIYEIGTPDENSPVLITSNFSLTYFIVSAEIENSKISSWLLVKDTEGLSVLTAWAAGKFVADAIGPFVKKSGIAEKVKHQKLIIPGYLASESGGLEEELPDWEIQVGPREGAHITAYLKSWTA